MVVGEHLVPTRRGWAGKPKLIDVTDRRKRATGTVPKKRSLSPSSHYNHDLGEENGPFEKKQRKYGRVSNLLFYRCIY